MPRNFKGIETKLIHSGEPDPRIQGAISMPIFQTAMFEYAGEKGYHAIRYIRLNNTPNHLALHQKLAALENAEAALVTASGMAAISTTLLTVLSSGDHLLAQDCLYGGTHDFVTNDFASFGIGYDFIDGEDPASWKKKLRPNTRAVYVEISRIYDGSNNGRIGFSVRTAATRCRIAKDTAKRALDELVLAPLTV